MEPVLSNLKDISAGGVRFWSQKFMPEGTLLKVSTVVPPIDLKIEALARVIRTRRAKNNFLYYIAAVFLEIPKADQDKLDRFIEELSRGRRSSFVVDHASRVRRQSELEYIS